jgi:hypothetical protein
LTLGELPAQIHRILHADVEALSTDRGVHVRRVAGQQDPPVAVGRRLPGHVAEPGDPGRTVDPVVGPVDGDQAFAEIAQRGLARSDLRFGQHHSDRPALLVDHLALLDLVLHLAEGVRAGGSAVDAQFRFLGHLDFGEQAARRRIPARELDPGCLADQTASFVAPHEILRPHRAAVGKLNLDAGVGLHEACHLTSAVDRDRQLVDPAGQDALDVLLPQAEPVVVPGGKVADVQPDGGEAGDLGNLSLGEEPIGDATLIEDLDGACVQAAVRRSRRRRPPAPARPPASAQSGLLRRSPPHARSSPHAGRDL